MKKLTLALLLLTCACSDRPPSSYSIHGPKDSAEINITSDGKVISHVLYQNNSKLNTFSCRRDKADFVYLDGRLMVPQPDGSTVPQWMQLFFPLADESGRAVQLKWDQKSRVMIVGRLADPEHLNLGINAGLQGKCIATLHRRDNELKGRIDCKNFHSDDGDGNLASFDLKVVQFNCTIQD